MKEVFFLNPKRRRKARRSGSRRSRRRSFRRNPVGVARRKKRRGGRRRSRSLFGGGVGKLNLKSVLNKDLLMTAGGAVGGALLTGILWKKFGPYATDANGNLVKDASGNLVAKGPSEFKLPFSDSQYGGVIYQSVIPIALGILAQRVRALAPLAKGAVIGGLASGVSYVVNRAMASRAVAGSSAYLNRPYVPAGVGRLPGPRNHSAVDQFSGAITPSRAFRTAAWRR